MELLRNSQVLALMLSNFGMCMTSELLFNVYPLFAYTPIESGELLFFFLIWFSYLFCCNSPILVVVTVMPLMSKSSSDAHRFPHATHKPRTSLLLLLFDSYYIRFPLTLNPRFRT